MRNRSIVTAVLTARLAVTASAPAGRVARAGLVLIRHDGTQPDATLASAWTPKELCQ